MKWDDSLKPLAVSAPADEEEVIAGKLTDIKTGADDRELEDGAYLGGMFNPNKAVAGSAAMKTMGRQLRQVMEEVAAVPRFAKEVNDARRMLGKKRCSWV